MINYRNIPGCRQGSRGIMFLLLALIITACNDGAFSTPPAGDIPPLLLTDDGQERCVKFSFEKWPVTKLVFSDPGNFQSVVIHDNDTLPGNTLRGNGMITATSPDVDVRLLRQGSILTIAALGDSLMTDTVSVTVEMCDDSTGSRAELPVKICPTL